MSGLHDLNDFQKGWVAGIMEGEGWFGNPRGYLRVEVEMCDQDIIEKMRDLVAPQKKVNKKKKKSQVHYKDVYRLTISGEEARLLMIDLFPYLSVRRQDRIQELILEYGERYV